MTGEPIELLRYCGANDVGLLTPDTDAWALETVVAESNEAMSGMPASDFGWWSVTGPDSRSIAPANRQSRIGMSTVAACKVTTLTRADMQLRGAAMVVGRTRCGCRRGGRRL